MIFIKNVIIAHLPPRIFNTDAVDSIITAELPLDPNTMPPGKKWEQAKRLQDIVLTNMIHGPYGEANPI